MPKQTPKTLENITVVSFEQAVAGPYCSMKLADAGARVIKIERPEGDFARGYDQAAAGLSSYFVWLNRGKQSLVADIKNPADAALLHRIVDRADIFIQNLAPGAASRAGFDAPRLRARNPGLITLDISGYGEDGAYASMKAYDLLIQAESGLASVTGRPDGAGRVGISICDIACGVTGYAAVLEALVARAGTGHGQALSVSLFDAIADWMTVPLLLHEASGRQPPRMGLAHASICPYGAFTLADGDDILIAIQNEREWRNFCAAVLEQPRLPADPRATTNTDRVANRAWLEKIVAGVLIRLSREQAVARLLQAGIAFGFVRDIAGLSAHPALRRQPVETQGGPVRLVAPPVRGPNTSPLGAVPTLGQHSPQIRREFAA